MRKRPPRNPGSEWDITRAGDPSTNLGRASEVSSRVFDASGTVMWRTAAWTRDVRTGTSFVSRVRMGNTPTPDSTWTTFNTLSSSGVTIGGSSRYNQHQVQLAMTVSGQSPVLRDITVSY
jgi:hypothetical protein